MKLTTKGKYALPAVLDLINNSGGKAVQIKTISERQNIPKIYLSQLFRKLGQHGIVKSIRGPGGGYVIGRPADQITIKDVLSAAGELMDYVETIALDENSSKELHDVIKYFYNLDEVVRTYLEKSLDKLV